METWGAQDPMETKKWLGCVGWMGMKRRRWWVVGGERQQSVATIYTEVTIFFKEKVGK